jgi:hypothetical protein
MNPSEEPSKDVENKMKELFSQRSRAINMDGLEGYKPGLWTRLQFFMEDHNPFSVYACIATPDEYINMPRNERLVWGMFYKNYYINDGKSFMGRKKDREKVDKFIKETYPIQHFFRKNGYSLYIKLSRFKDAVDYFLNPRQKWLTKQIPKSWCDKTGLLEDLNFAMVVHFIEGEKALDATDWAGSGDLQDTFSKELMDCYDYIKNRKPILQKQYEDSFPDEENRTGVYDIDYAENNRLELLISEEDTKYLTWIVKNRGFFWT